MDEGMVISLVWLIACPNAYRTHRCSVGCSHQWTAHCSSLVIPCWTTILAVAWTSSPAVGYFWCSPRTTFLFSCAIIYANMWARLNDHLLQRHYSELCECRWFQFRQIRRIWLGGQIAGSLRKVTAQSRWPLLQLCNSQICDGVLCTAWGRTAQLMAAWFCKPRPRTWSAGFIGPVISSSSYFFFHSNMSVTLR